MKIATLGPSGTFSHEAALRIDPGAELLFQRTIRDVFTVTGAGGAELGVVPLENSVAGSVGETMDALMESELTIVREHIHPVVHHLAALGDPPGRIARIFAHPQSYAQCEKFIAQYCPEAEIIPTSSNGKSAELLREPGPPGRAALVPGLAVSLYGLTVVRSAVQDNRYNVTRFVALSRHSCCRPSGYDRTSLAIYPQVDYPGLLYEMLGLIASQGINLSKIESRPSKGRLGDYIFFLDVLGHREDDRVAATLEELGRKAFLKVLGSYPRQY